MINPIYTTDPRKGRKILAGYINDDTATFRKEVNSKKHFLNVADGYAIQKEIYDALLDRVGYIEIYEKDTKDTYIATIDDWKEHSWLFSKGHGDQMAMALRFMTKK